MPNSVVGRDVISIYDLTGYRHPSSLFQTARTLYFLWARGVLVPVMYVMGSRNTLRHGIQRQLAGTGLRFYVEIRSG